MIKKESQKVILYAPTWEATHPSMNYTSVPIFGEKLVKKILENDEYILIYKPHSAVGARSDDVRVSNENIMKMISQSENAFYMGEEDINDVFTLVDFTFFLIIPQ